MTYIEIGEWPLMQAAAQKVRTAVFVKEQGIAPEDEWDADDATALHAVLFDLHSEPVGNAAHGFSVASEPFDEVGIPHIEMRLSLV